MKYILTVFGFLTLIISPIKASKIIVSTDIGFDPVDNSSFLQFAFDETTEDTIVIDDVGMDWNTGPLRMERNDVTIIFEEGVVLHAIFGAFDIFESMITISDKTNVNIIGYGATFVMNKQEYVDLADSEFRHVISLNSATNIRIEGLAILDTGGDGILVTRSFQPNSEKNYCENIWIENCRFSNNYRQGLSVTSAKDLTILNCEFSNTNGTLPEDGIDLEPDNAEERLENILIKGCRMFNNFGNAVQLALFMMDDNSIDVSITVEDTYMSNNHDPSNTFSFAEIAATDNKSNGVDGFVNFNNCYIESSQWTAVYVAKTVESYDLNFTNCVFKNVSQSPIALNNPIFLEVTDYSNQVPRFGGLNFNDCTIIYDENIPFLNSFENLPTSDGLGNVNGNFYIINPNDAGFISGTNPNNVYITYQYFESIPVSEVNLSASQLAYNEEDQIIEFEVTRTGSQEIPIAAEFEYSGTADYGLDYSRANGFVIFPSDVSTILDSIDIIQDEKEEPLEFITMSFLDNDCLEIGSDSELEFTIDDIISSISLEQDLINYSIQLFPNPSADIVNIVTKSSDFGINIYNESGQLYKSFRNQSYNLSIDMSFLNQGVYYIEIIDELTDARVFEKVVRR